MTVFTVQSLGVAADLCRPELTTIAVNPISRQRNDREGESRMRRQCLPGGTVKRSRERATLMALLRWAPRESDCAACFSLVPVPVPQLGEWVSVLAPNLSIDTPDTLYWSHADGSTTSSCLTVSPCPVCLHAESISPTFPAPPGLLKMSLP